MRRLLRWTFHALAAASLLLCLAAAGLWVRSYFISDQLEWTTLLAGADGAVLSTRQFCLHSGGGWWSEVEYTSDPDNDFTLGSGPARAERRSFEWRHTPGPLTIQFEATRYGGELPVPYWLTCLVLASPVTVRTARPWIRRRSRSHREQERRSRGLWPACGYDLRATPGRCPECGAVPAEAAR